MITDDDLGQEPVGQQEPTTVAEPGADPDDASEEGRPPFVSAVLPVYNVEPYIGRCIEGLQAQTMDELEFIFVDDCSPDGSMMSVEEWAKRDGRVRIIRNEANLGEGGSRNAGTRAAQGAYFCSLDPKSTNMFRIENSFQTFPGLPAAIAVIV